MIELKVPEIFSKIHEKDHDQVIYSLKKLFVEQPLLQRVCYYIILLISITRLNSASQKILLSSQKVRLLQSKFSLTVWLP